MKFTAHFIFVLIFSLTFSFSFSAQKEKEKSSAQDSAAKKKEEVFKKISFELLYLLTHRDFNVEKCEIINNNTYLYDVKKELKTNINVFKINFFSL